MALLRVSARSLRERSLEGRLGQVIAEQFRHEVGYTPGAGEIRSWERSLPVLADDLLDAGLDDVEVLVEYRLPLSSKRIDAVLTSVHPKTGRPSYVVVELKQWSDARLLDESNELVHVDAYGKHPVPHPVEQVRRYWARSSGTSSVRSNRRTTRSPERRTCTTPRRAPSRTCSTWSRPPVSGCSLDRGEASG